MFLTCSFLSPSSLLFHVNADNSLSVVMNSGPVNESSSCVEWNDNKGELKWIAVAINGEYLYLPTY